jgi:hydrogenase expression/formation protein HypC
MCLAIPGKLLEIYEEAGMKMGKVDYSGVISKVCLEYVPEIEIGQYTVVHAGFALSIIDEEEAALSFAAWREYNAAARREGGYEFGATSVAGNGKKSGE